MRWARKGVQWGSQFGEGWRWLVREGMDLFGKLRLRIISGLNQQDLYHSLTMYLIRVEMSH